MTAPVLAVLSKSNKKEKKDIGDFISGQDCRVI